MFYVRLIYTSLRSLDSHFLRSLLATLGVLIGVSSVVACMSILEGAQKDIFDRFKAMGSNTLYVFPAEARVEGRSVGVAQTLTLETVDTLMDELGEQIDQIAPMAEGRTHIKRFQKHGDFTLIATTRTFFELNSFEAHEGAIFSPGQSEAEDAAVAILGSKAADKLFGGAAPVGQTVKLGGATYRVIGVMEEKGGVGFMNVDDTVFVPIKAGLKRFFNRKWLSRLTVAAKDNVDLDELEKEVQRVLRRAHKIPVGEDDDFTIFNQEEALRNITGAMLVFKVVFYSIAGISLVVGGIGIMNIMLVSVTERTREIGVRMAVGARRGDILLQFLVEALVISFIGGGLGLLLGAMFADVMEKVLRQMNFKTDINATIILASLLTATLVGVASGIYPAFKASRLDPVEALRYE